MTTPEWALLGFGIWLLLVLSIGSLILSACIAGKREDEAVREHEWQLHFKPHKEDNDG